MKLIIIMILYNIDKDKLKFVFLPAVNLVKYECDWKDLTYINANMPQSLPEKLTNSELITCTLPSASVKQLACPLTQDKSPQLHIIVEEYKTAKTSWFGLYSYK